MIGRKNGKHYKYCSMECMEKKPMKDFTDNEKVILKEVVESTGEFMERLNKFDFNEWEYEDAESFVEFVIKKWAEVVREKSPDFKQE